MAATLGYAGFLLGPPFIGFVADLIGLRVALTTLFAAALIVAVTGRRVVGPRFGSPAT